MRPFCGAGRALLNADLGSASLTSNTVVRDPQLRGPVTVDTWTGECSRTMCSRARQKKTPVAIQKEGGHTFTLPGNRFIGNELAGLLDTSVAHESEVLKKN